jgi:outer membrane protein OmpA-like peptidoglycan-associated protein
MKLSVLPAVLGLAVGIGAGTAMLTARPSLPAVATVTPPGTGLEPAWWEATMKIEDPNPPEVSVGVDKPVVARPVTTVDTPAVAANTTYRVPGDVLFAVDSSMIDDRSRKVLLALVPELTNAVAIVVCGATDSTGTRAHNLELSLARADAARQVLVGAGIPGYKMTVEAWADDHPVVDEYGPDPAQARALNRRIEIVVTTVGVAAN